MKASIVSLVAVAGSAALVLEASAKPVRPFTATIELHKREGAALTKKDGQVNFEKAQQHLATVLAKYQNGIANYQVVNGEPLLGARKLSKRELERFSRKRGTGDDDEWADDKDWAGWDDKADSSENGEGPEDWEDEQISGWPLNAKGSEDVADVDGTTDVDADNSPFADVDPIEPANNSTSTEDEADESSDDNDESEQNQDESEQEDDGAQADEEEQTDDEGDEDWSEADSGNDDDSSQDEEQDSDGWAEEGSGEDDAQSQEDWVVLDTSDFSDLDGPAEAPTVAEAFTVSSRQFSGNPRAILPAAPRFDTWKRINSVAEVDIVEKPVVKRAAKTTKTTKTSTTGSVALTDYQDGLLWYGVVSIGTPAKSFKIDFDTGSADLWIPASVCKSCGSHAKYDPTASTTSSAVSGTSFNVQYGDGSSTSGKVYKDTVALAGVSVTGQMLGAAKTLSNGFQTDPMDGILGMGWSSLSSMGATPVFASMMAQNSVATQQFSFNLGAAGPKLLVGGSDASAFSGSLEWHNLVSKSYWVVSAKAMVGTTAASGNINAIIDTGTTVIVAPTKDAAAFWKKVSGAKAYGGGFYSYPCSSNPAVSFNFGGSDWALSADTLNLGSTGKSNQCLGAIIGQDIGLNAWILGGSFLQNVYATFDMGAGRVGFAKPK